MASSNKSTFNQFQSLVAILTPVIVAIGGVYGYMLKDKVAIAESKATEAQTQIAAIETSIKNVEAMETYFKMMGGENDAEAKMAAYALYMLNKKNPEMTVSMIMAPGKEDLMAVLIDLGSRDEEILKEVQKILQTQDDTREGTPMQQSAQKIVGEVGNATIAPSAEVVAASEDAGNWSFLGNFETGEGTRIDLPAGVWPNDGSSYTLNRDVNLRSDYPNKENAYQNGDIIGVARAAEEITILESKPDNKNRLWARISVAAQ